MNPDTPAPPQRQFSWPGLLVALLAVAVCVRLGLWQLDRAEQKAAYLNTIEHARQQAPAPLDEVLALPDPHLMPATLSGHFRNDRTVLLDNRMHQQRAGYHVLSPFVTDQGQTLLVNRGWLERALERRHLPAVAPIEGHQQLEGHLYRPPDAFVLQQELPEPGSALLVVQSINLEQLSDWYGTPLLPFEFRIDGNEPLGHHQEILVRDWQERVMGPNTHYGYAVQWFAFAAIALVIFILASRRRLPTATPGEPNP